MRKQKFIIILIISLILNGCSSYDYNKKLNSYIIKIDKINLNMEYKISSKNDIIREIVMFEECGRPNITNSNTVIGAHSGSANYAYFNEINLLDYGDIISLTYKNKTYNYMVIEVKEVEDSQIEILDNKDISMLTLLTCKIKDNTKRIVVVANLVN